jgi:hypothetical protein
MQSDQLPREMSPLFTPRLEDDQQAVSIAAVKGMENAAIIKLASDEHLTATNWIVWHERMIIMLQLCEVYEYTQGLIEKPNSLLDPLGARNWMKNDNYAKHLLTSNITTTEMMNLGRPSTSFDCWNQLVALYEIKTHDTIVAFT